MTVSFSDLKAIKFPYLHSYFKLEFSGRLDFLLAPLHTSALDFMALTVSIWIQGRISPPIQLGLYIYC